MAQIQQNISRSYRSGNSQRAVPKKEFSIHALPKRPKLFGDLEGTVRISVRLQGKSTSVSIKKNLLALWILFTGVSTEDIRNAVYNLIYFHAREWKGSSAKGFSAYIYDVILKEILEKEDYDRVQKIMVML